MAKRKYTQQKPQEKPWYFYVYGTGHGMPSHFILHVGYSQANSNPGYPTWFSEGMDLETAHKIHEKVHWMDHTEWTGDKAIKLKEQINNYVKLAKEGKF